MLIAGPSHEQQRYLEILAGVTLRLKSEEVRSAALAAENVDEIIEVIATAK